MNQQANNSLVRLEPSRLPINSAIAKEFEVTSAEWRVLVDQIFPSAKSIESISMALAYCRQRKLDIFKKPVHIVPMWSTAKKQMVETVWPGISEIRTTAFRTGEYAGIDEVIFGPMIEREFKSENTDRNGDAQSNKKSVLYPEWAKVTAYRLIKGIRCAFHATVYWEEAYAAVGKTTVPNDMWAKRPRGQLDKCVEAAVLRKAFPEELGSIYTAEEMEGREIDTGGVATATIPQPATPPVPPKPPAITSDVKTATQATIDNEPLKPVERVADPINEILHTNSDPVTGEVIDDTGGHFDKDEFLGLLETWLNNASSEDNVETAWLQLDVEATLTHDADSLTIATNFKRDRLAQIKRGSGVRNTH